MTRVFRLPPGASLPEPDLQEVARAVREARLVAFPTDTVYGLGTTALIRAAVRRIYDVKRRDSMKPLPILVHSSSEARRWACWTPAAETLARRFWPGPLTLALRPTKEGRALTFAEFPLVAFRVPDHPLLLSLLKASGVPWASSSANRSGMPELCEGESVAAEFDGAVDFVIASGRSGGTVSTVVDASGEKPLVLREGALSREDIERAVMTGS
ncbi:MAG TPA: threonylcarbamoyl-AMP synthase [Elusimicrobia bacterium]|nr:threonylcarbamoyl-AMP synthase [Elusimicrobiota bacterium]